MKLVHVNHIIPYLDVVKGGPVISLRELVHGLAKKGCKITVTGTVDKRDGRLVAFHSGVEILTFSRLFGGKLRWCPGLIKNVSSREYNIIHSHGLWTYMSYAAGKISKQRKIPHMLAPCGMLYREALRRSWWKKFLIRLLFQNRVLNHAACFHAKSEAEYESIKAFGLRQPVAIIPNPVAIPPTQSPAFTVDDFLKKHRLSNNRKFVLYLGRLHSRKGLEQLLYVWALLREFHHTWHLLIAGPDENNYKGTLLSLAKKLNCQNSVTFLGYLHEAEKWTALHEASLFVTPSDFENFGTAIAEAMMMGVPVIVTKRSPWQMLHDEQCGWWINPNCHELTKALKEALSLSDNERSALGAKTKRLMVGFQPDRVAEDMVKVYKWLLGDSPKPECVRIN